MRGCKKMGSSALILSFLPVSCSRVFHYHSKLIGNFKTTAFLPHVSVAQAPAGFRVVGRMGEVCTGLGFVGAGAMAEAIARGLDNAKVVPFSRMHAADVNQSRREFFQKLGMSAYESNHEVVRNSDVVILAVKPQVAKQVVEDLKPTFDKKHLLISIAAGVTLSSLEEWAGAARVIRVMPNTPCFVGETAAAMTLGKNATKDDAQLVKSLFEAVGKIHLVEEKLLNAVTGLSGSGPAYVFIAIEALADGGVAAGLPRDIALSLAAQTVLGSAKMVLTSGKHPGKLKDEVASPAGTTMAGIHELEKAGVRAAFMNAVIAAADKSEKLSKM